MGKISKGIKCSVQGCINQAVRSISLESISKSHVNLELESKGRRIYLCREHYKQYKKALRKLKLIEKWRRGP